MLNSGIEVLTSGRNLERLFEGLIVSAKISLIAVIISCVLGIILGIIMTSRSNVIRLLCRIYLEMIRIIPILVWLFVFHFGLPRLLNIHIEAELSSIVVFSLWGTAEMGDLVRGAVQSLPKHQMESAKAIGLNKIQSYYYVIIPQAVRRIVPAAMNLVTRMIKTTSLVVLIGVVEVVKVGQQIIEVSILNNPLASFWVYTLIFVLYFVVCYPISLLSKKLETRWEQ